MISDTAILDLREKTVSIFGLKGSGKSSLLKAIVVEEPQHFIWDPLRELPDSLGGVEMRRYYPREKDSEEEAALFVRRVASELPNNKLLAFDEANQIARPRARLPKALRDLADFSRHLGTGLVWIARRPVTLHTDLVELSDYICCYTLAGKNDQQYLNSLSRGLGDLVPKLPRYHFALVRPDRSYTVCAPVPLYVD